MGKDERIKPRAVQGYLSGQCQTLSALPPSPQVQECDEYKEKLMINDNLAH